MIQGVTIEGVPAKQKASILNEFRGLWGTVSGSDKKESASMHFPPETGGISARGLGRKKPNSATELYGLPANFKDGISVDQEVPMHWVSAQSASRIPFEEVDIWKKLPSTLSADNTVRVAGSSRPDAVHVTLPNLSIRTIPGTNYSYLRSADAATRVPIEYEAQSDGRKESAPRHRLADLPLQSDPSSSDQDEVDKLSRPFLKSKSLQISAIAGLENEDTVNLFNCLLPSLTYQLEWVKGHRINIHFDEISTNLIKHRSLTGYEPSQYDGQEAIFLPGVRRGSNDTNRNRASSSRATQHASPVGSGLPGLLLFTSLHRVDDSRPQLVAFTNVSATPMGDQTVKFGAEGTDREFTWRPPAISSVSKTEKGYQAFSWSKPPPSVPLEDLNPSSNAITLQPTFDPPITMPMQGVPWDEEVWQAAVSYLGDGEQNR